MQSKANKQCKNADKSQMKQWETVSILNLTQSSSCNFRLNVPFKVEDVMLHQCLSLYNITNTVILSKSINYTVKLNMINKDLIK